MLTFRQFNEKFVNSLKPQYGSGKIYDIWVNPQSKEIKEIPAHRGYRLTLDLQNRQLYVADATVLHHDLFANLNFGRTISYDSVIQGKQDRFFTFAAREYNGKKFVGYESDSFDSERSSDVYYSVRKGDDEGAQIIYDNAGRMLQRDWSFADRWVDTKKLQQYVIQLRKKLKKNYNIKDTK